MTYLHTSPTDATAPLWLFHLPTFTLAQLQLNAGPQDEHLLTVDAATPPPDEAIIAFAKTLETMAPGASTGLFTITREGIAKDLPESLPFAPADSQGDCILVYPRKRTTFPFTASQAT